MSDTKPFTHGQEGTHGACNDRLGRYGAEAQCCACYLHEPCDYGVTSDSKKIPYVEKLVQVEGMTVGSIDGGNTPLTTGAGGVALGTKLNEIIDLVNNQQQRIEALERAKRMGR